MKKLLSILIVLVVMPYLGADEAVRDKHGRLHLPVGKVILEDGSVLFPRWISEEKREEGLERAAWPNHRSPVNP